MNKTPYEKESHHPDRVFKRSYKTVQGISTLSTYLLILVLWRYFVDINTASYCVVGLLSSFVVGRTIYKKNRGMSRTLTGEAVTIILAFIWALYSLYFGVDHKLIMVLVVVHISIFNLCRGVSESVPCRTMFISR